MHSLLCILLVVGICVASASTIHAQRQKHGKNDATTAAGSFPDCSASAPIGQFPICDPSLDWGVRVADLLSRMTISEKISWLGDSSPAIPRLGLPSYEWWSEALHGVAFSPGVNFTSGPINAATSFPEPIGLAATFDRKMVQAVADVISTEARAMNSQGQAGITFFTPNINLFRDPRWGRGQETPGEDPYLTSQYVLALVAGLQGGEDSRYIKIVTDCKHYLAYDLEDWEGVDRFHFNAIVADQDLVESYLPAFESCVKDARGASVMCSYNAMNGVPSCANTWALQTVLREEYNFDGFVVSDCGAIQAIMSSHNYTQTEDETVAAALSAGTDLNCGSFYQDYTQHALESGVIQESQIDQALTRSIGVLLRTGWFDPAEIQPYRQYTPQDVNTENAQVLALNAAENGIVLLKNAGEGALPWSQGSSPIIAIIGPLRNATGVMQGNYNGQAPQGTLIDPVIAFAQAGWIVLSVPGCEVDGNDTSGFAAAFSAASQADAVLFLGGLDQSVESEGNDRTSIALPGVQAQLIQALAQQSTVPRFAVGVFGGGQVDLSFARDTYAISSILWLGYPGEFGGVALERIISGVTSPAGRLPLTMYPAEYVNQVSMFDMSYRQSASNPGRTHRFYPNTSSVYPFGTGLSYTQFQFEWIDDDMNEATESIVEEFSILDLARAHAQGHLNEPISYRVNVTNIGGVTSDVVVLLFLYSTVPNAPLQELIGFDRIQALIPGETQQVFFGIQARQLATVDEHGRKWLMPGEYTLGIDVPNRRTRTFKLTGLARKLK